MNGARNQKGARVVIGLAALAMSVVLLYFSAWPALSCTRGPEAGVECAISAKALGRIPVHDARVSGVRSVEMVASATGRSRTPPRIMFVAGGTRQDLGYFSQQFAGDWKQLDEFARNPAQPELRLDKPLTVRTVAAYLAFFVLLAIGVGMTLSAFRSSH